MFSIVETPSTDNLRRSVCDFVRHKIPSRELYGSFRTGEIAFFEENNSYYLLSDIDIGTELGDKSFYTLRLALSQMLDGVSIDASSIEALTSKAQRVQRNLAVGQQLAMRVSSREIDEAIVIRAFYSSMDFAKACISKDIPRIAYSTIRLIAEIPLYYCWANGAVIAGYRQQAQFASNYTSMNGACWLDEVLYCSRIKSACFSLPYGTTVDRIIHEAQDTVRIFIEAANELISSNESLKFVKRIGESIMHTEIRSTNSIPRTLSELYPAYCMISDDGIFRGSYLKGRIATLLKQSDTFVRPARVWPHVVSVHTNSSA